VGRFCARGRRVTAESRARQPQAFSIAVSAAMRRSASV
jgi:hypothetical protein